MNLPKVVDLRSKLKPYDQGEIGSSVVCALALAVQMKEDRDQEEAILLAYKDVI